MSLALIVTNAFGDFAKGDLISDPKAVTDVLASDASANVVRVNVPDAPAPKPPRDASE